MAACSIETIPGKRAVRCNGNCVLSATQIDIDDEALAEAMRLMGTTTKAVTVNIALREYAKLIKRLDAAEKLGARACR